jgi:hypothetical protein
MAKPGEVCVYQFKVVLRGVSPMIWRRILLRSDQTIADLHYTIQIAMGWSDSHLNRFHIHGKDYGVAHEGGIWFDDNPKKVHLAGFGFRLRERFPHLLHHGVGSGELSMAYSFTNAVVTRFPPLEPRRM